MQERVSIAYYKKKWKAVGKFVTLGALLNLVTPSYISFT
jgi:hypothetical protein